jgi:putative oxidoreductase
MKLAFTAFRAAVGAVFLAHGTQKLFGWFGGHGLENTGKAFDSIGLKPGRRMALAAGASEAGGGALLATGFLTPVGAAATIGVMTQATRTVHWSKGFFVTEGGYEYNLTLIAAAFAIAEHGPGPISLDRLLGTERRGTIWALAALAAGVAGPRLVERFASQPEPAPAEAPRFTRDAQETRETAGAAS